ncbi:tyrosine-type recombinase/integrase [Sphingobium bisphenolivorans]|uniref:tyrosine-type recombinase/integrase n=1 Tax=Sphingobium bisphenolivorans TaxID=1335760 RepID=UPI0003A2EFB1|nr:site-specific integrase [Sphingobium bisphenolivorans]
MTSIRKRSWNAPDGSEKTAWLVDYRDQAGKRRAKSFARKKDAEAWLVGAAWQVSQGVHTPDSASVTVKKAAELWIEKAEAEDRERSTVKQYKELERLHISPLIGSVKLSRLTMPMVEQYRDDLIATRSRAMAGKAVRALSMVLAEAQRRGLVAQNVAKGVKVVRQGREKAKIEIPTKQELKALLTAATDDEKPLIMTAILTGLRSSELRGLRWADVNLKKATISVSQRADQWGEIGPPKSAAGFRTVPISPALVTVLKAWKLRCPNSTLDLVFPTTTGTPQLHQNMLRRKFIPLQVRAGVTRPKLDAKDKPVMDQEGQPVLTGRYGFHALRHAAASGWIAQRIDLKRLQIWIGHENIQLTIDTYGHLIVDAGGDADLIAAAGAEILEM